MKNIDTAWLAGVIDSSGHDITTFGANTRIRFYVDIQPWLVEELVRYGRLVWKQGNGHNYGPRKRLEFFIPNQLYNEVKVYSKRFSARARDRKDS